MQSMETSEKQRRVLGSNANPVATVTSPERIKPKKQVDRLSESGLLKVGPQF